MTTNTNKVQLPEYDQGEADREALMFDKGVERYHSKAAREHKAGQLTKPEMNLIEASIKDVAAAIRTALDTVRDNREKNPKYPGTMPFWFLPVSLLDTDLLAYIALNSLFGSVIAKSELRKAVDAMGEQVEMEVWRMDFQNSDPDLFKRLVKMACKNNDTQAYRLKAMKIVAAKEQHPYVVWDDQFRAAVGGVMLNAVLSATEIFETYDVQSTIDRRTKNYVGFTKGAKDCLSEADGIYSVLRPVYMPMLTQPKPWDSMYTGAYNDERLAAQLPFLRTHNRTHITKVVDAFKKGSMAPVVAAVNAIQAVPLMVNPEMLKVLEHCWSLKLPVKGLPAVVPFTHAPYPGDEAWIAMEIPQKKLWKREKKLSILKNRAMESDCFQIGQDIGIAKELLGKPFALPCSLDFRGRVYPIPTFNHQRSDHIRNLFMFANGKPLGIAGARWLAIHVASTGDFDKVSKESFKTRVEWTHLNTEMLERIGNDPVGTVEEWAAADKPFSFVAACIEWAKYKQVGPDYVSHLPIPLDGSNSGQQHFAAASRCEKGGELVNLMPSVKPKDMYATVAKLCSTQVQQDAQDENSEHQAMAQLWTRFGVNRKVVKRSVMVFSYSSEAYGFRKQIITDLMEPMQDEVLRGRLAEHAFGTEDTYTQAAGYMAGLIWEAVNVVVVRAAEGMRFLQKCASALAHESKPATWITPMGLPVENMYQEWDTKRVQLFLNDRRVKAKDASVTDRVASDGSVDKRLTIQFNTKPTGVIKKAKCKSTIAANWIHSLDAAHLQAAVNAATEVGITDMLLIHDSFSTHACDTSEFQGVIKRTFVDMYLSHDVFAEFRENCMADISEKGMSKIPPLPDKGALDLEQVMFSDYCFS